MDATRAATMPENVNVILMGAGETRSTTRDKEMIQWKVRKWIRCWIPFNLMCFSLNFFSFCFFFSYATLCLSPKELVSVQWWLLFNVEQFFFFKK